MYMALESSVLVWQRVHPEAWYGVFYLGEFWGAVLAGLALLWSIWRDRRLLRTGAP
jgi:hypothetical protein